MEITVRGALEIPLELTPGGWVRLRAPNGLGAYLRHLLYLFTNKTIRLHAPMRGLHISVAEPNRATKELLALLGNTYPVLLDMTTVWTNGNAVFVESDVTDLLPHKRTASDFHLCFGYFTQEATKYVR